MCDSRVVHQDVETMPQAIDLGKPCPNLRGIGDIACDRVRPAPGGSNRLDGSVCRGLVHVQGDDVRTLTAEYGRNGLTNARAAAGDDGEFPGEVKQDAARGEVLYFNGKVKEIATLSPVPPRTPTLC